MELGSSLDTIEINVRGTIVKLNNSLLDNKLNESKKNKIIQSIKFRVKSLFDNSVEGLKLKNKPIFSVQYHPEANPGPQDSKYLFDLFIKEVKNYAKKKRY